jgi:hypothetical protein
MAFGHDGNVGADEDAIPNSHESAIKDAKALRLMFPLVQSQQEVGRDRGF